MPDSFIGLKFLRLWGLLLLTLPLVVGCAGRLQSAANRYHNGQPEQALTTLQKGDTTGGRSKLLYFMEQGTVLHRLGRYAESARQLLKAAQLVEEFERISLSEQASSLVTNDWLMRYKGEYSERLLIHSYLIMDYLLLDKFDDALVEAKRALKVLKRYPTAVKTAYFTRALVALCFNQLNEDNDALLVYQKLGADLPSPTPVAADLVRLAANLGQTDLVNRYRPYLPRPLPAGESELVLFIANGQIPAKRPENILLPPAIRFSFPSYPRVNVPKLSATLTPLNPTALPAISSDLAHLARQSLSRRKAQVIGREILRVTSKEVLAQDIGRKQGPAAEALARIVLILLEEPDTRSWRTLPGRLTLARIPIPAGYHQFELRLENSFGQTQRIKLAPLNAHKGQRLFRAIYF